MRRPLLAVASRALPPPSNILGPLSVRGPVIDCNGQPWRWIGSSCFCFPYRVWAGDTRCDAILDSYQAAGFNVLRMFWAITIMPPKRTDHLGRPLPKGRVPLDVCQTAQAMANARGMFVEWTSGDWQTMPELNAVAEIETQASIVGWNPLERRNEPWQNGLSNEQDADQEPALPGVFESSGVYRLQNDWEGRKADEMLQWIPGLRTYFTRHHQRKDEWPRLSHDAMEFWDGWQGTVDSGEHKGENEYFAGVHPCPYVDNEPQMFTERSNPESDESNSPADAFDFAAGMAMFSAGCTFHSEPGKDALPFTPVVAECARQWVEGLRLVPFDQPFGEYTRGGRSNCPLIHKDEPAPDGALRTYCMIRGNTCVSIVVRPGPQWTAQADNGWTITDQLGSRRNLIFLTR